MSNKIAILGAGLVGSAWAIVFARAGYSVSLFDCDAAQSKQALSRVSDNMGELVGFGLLDDAEAALAHISIAGSLGEALDGATYAQESVFERSDVKTEFYLEIDKVAGAELVIGSSSSGIPASVFTEGLACARRCLVAHPINPPYLIPLVEVVPTPWTSDAAVQNCWDIMLAVGMEPVRLTREVDGFIANRLQAVLLWEAFRLLDAGIATVEDIDKTISAGLGRRWTFIGPFETIDLNAPGGLKDYAARLAPGFFELVKQAEPAEPWSDAVIAKADGAMRAHLPLPDQPARQVWRDKRLMALVKHFQEVG